MCWDVSSGSWREWDKDQQEKAFWDFGGGQLETTGLGPKIGVHSLVYLYFNGFQSLGVGVLLALGGYELASV
jgi:hypothetical protein